MPNRPDQSVKIRGRDRGKSVKSYWLIGGSLLSGFGALAVTLAGGQAGALLGASVFTVLIILQVAWLITEVRQSARGPARPRSSATPARPANDPNRDPILIINVSDLGRVRSLWGQSQFVPGLQVGSVMERFIKPGVSEIDTKIGGQSLKLAVLRVPTRTGNLLILTIAKPGHAGIDQQVLERTKFFAGLGHDLKSPLNAVIGFADVMDAEIRGPMPEAYKDYPGLIRESGEALLRLVEDILGYAKSEAGTYDLDLAAMDIAASGESVLRQSQAMADKAGIKLVMKMDQEVLALADASAVRRIWDNLVSNAIKYSTAGDTVTLVAGIRGDKAVLQVRDTGAGMDAEDLERIASPFAQGRNAKGRSGSGLGLALVHRLADLQNGAVQIETSLGVGTTVTVTLPAVNEHQKRAAE